MKRILTFLISISLLFAFSGAGTFAAAMAVESSMTTEGTITVAGQTPYAEERVKVIVKDASGEIVHIGQVKSDAAQHFSLSFKKDTQWAEGDYTVEASALTGSASDSFELAESDDTGGNDNNDDNDNEKDKYVYVSIKGPDGYIMQNEMTLPKSGESVWDVSKRLMDDEDIDYDVGVDGYVKMIGGYREKDYGSNSGWKITVNRDHIQTAAENVDAAAGQKIKWYYTTDYTKDKDSSSNGSSGGGGMSGGTGNPASDAMHPREILKQAAKNGEGAITSYNIKLYEDAALNELERMKSVTAFDELESYSMDLVKNVVSEILTSASTLESKAEKSEKFLKQYEALRSAVSDETVQKTIQLQTNKIVKDLIRFASAQTVTFSDVDIYNGELQCSADETIQRAAQQFDASMEKISNLVSSFGASKKSVADRVIGINIDRNMDVYKVRLTPKVLIDLESNRIDAVRLNTGNASVQINKELLGQANETLEIDIRKVKSEEESDKAVAYAFDMKSGTRPMAQFEEPIRIEIPYETESDKPLTVYYVDEEGNRELVGGTYDPEFKMMTFITNHFSTFVVDEVDVNMSDIQTHKDKQDIESAISKGIISGRGNGIFDPYSTVTRAEFCVMLQNLTKYQGREQGLEFDDVQKTDWYYGAVSAISERGFVTGKGGATFDPDGVLTQEEVAVVASKLLSENGYTSSNISVLMDIPNYDSISPWAISSMAKALEFGIVEPTTLGKLNPQSQVTRADAARMMNVLHTYIYE